MKDATWSYRKNNKLAKFGYGQDKIWPLELIASRERKLRTLACNNLTNQQVNALGKVLVVECDQFLAINYQGSYIQKDSFGDIAMFMAGTCYLVDLGVASAKIRYDDIQKGGKCWNEFI